jgi:hypothetical protein
MENQLHGAAMSGNEEEVKKILKGNKGIDVNWGDRFGSTALHWACANGHIKSVTMLLAHPNINVNRKNARGNTPFWYACGFGNTCCVQLLLKNAKVTTLNEPNEDGNTPLWWSARDGQLEVIKWWIASGREMDLGEPGNERNDAIGVAKKKDDTEIVSLLEKFKVDPFQTRHEVRAMLGLLDQMTAEIFAMIIFVCDKLLEIKAENTTEAARVFNIAKRLPMELQMVLCYRVMGSMKTNISGEMRETSFKKLMRKLNCIE